MATLAPRKDIFFTLHASSTAITQPRAVASLRPSDPPIEIGFPVTTPKDECPLVMEYVSIIQAIVCESVYTSGAGISCSGPMIGRISAANRRVMRSSSDLLIRLGSQITPPFAPPKGIFTVAVFQVIHIASAFTSSSVTAG